ncbi:MAG: hypothetical protein BGO82_05990 [Devosia sp. 67-54]|uniref:hypothetical protein n=1 Tax=unclassified Devosia TaxID=196773 RepID=UPI00096592EC|nr:MULTISPECIES: hypothetical protein [unclassified Devosia]MBN9306830.1 hypothetical protein [Devosia sp.]OJX17062.1 MAG: hypothetical protein BGO82_05990 [Devosia sp. 67-54]
MTDSLSIGIPRLDKLAARIRALVPHVAELPLPAAIEPEGEGQLCDAWLLARLEELPWVARTCGGVAGRFVRPNFGNRTTAERFANGVIDMTIGASDATRNSVLADAAAALLLAIETGVEAIEDVSPGRVLH